MKNYLGNTEYLIDVYGDKHMVGDQLIGGKGLCTIVSFTNEVCIVEWSEGNEIEGVQIDDFLVMFNPRYYD